MNKSLNFKKMKQNGEKIVMMTAYDYPSAKYVEEAGADVILVGDSLGMVVLGYDSTISVTPEDMIYHTKAVNRGAKHTYIVTDMPFMSYHASVEETMVTARNMIQQSGANALKLEGAGRVLDKIEQLTEAGIPVVGHLGLTPQSVGVLGGYRVQGKDAESAMKLIDDAKKVEEAGAIALVLECVPKQIAERIAYELSIPTIGIGAGLNTDGQVLVYHDMLKYGVDRLPKFAKAFSDVDAVIKNGLSKYVEDVKNEQFPSEEHSFTMKEEELQGLYGGTTK